MMQEVAEVKTKPLSSNLASSSGGIFKSFKQIDLYPKIDENYRVQTSGGAALSLIGWALIGILCFAEMRNYLTPQFKEHMVVDTSLGQQLRVNLDITFHALTCAEVHLDAMDVAGDNQLNVEHEMMKQRLSRNGEPIGVPGVEIIGEGQVEVEPLPENYCGPCFGAETEEIKCCNSCESLVQAYEMKRWSIIEIIKNSTQCIRDRANHFAGVGDDEGCTVSGSMIVNKVAGNFHIAQGESVVRDGRHIHQFNPELAPKYNISHTINSISFGTPYPYMLSNPLDKVTRVVPQDGSTGLQQYFIKVIPTIYTNEYGKQTFTNQYTVTDRFRPLIIPSANGMPQQRMEAILPGIFFVYDLSPFMIEASRTRIPLFHLLTKLCAIIGGVFAVLGVLDTICFRLMKTLSRKK